jgi:D-glycerate 3-kinase
MNLQQLVETLSALLLARATTAPFIFGVSGGQGAGKSTLCQALGERLARHDKTALTLSLDDFYLSKAAREELATRVHPLCATRGVPGTHDVGLLAETLKNLAKASTERPIDLPRFSKSHDDRIAPAVLDYCPDFVFLEGWCVGGHSACIASHPQNEWEKTHDPDAIWKSWSQSQAAAYQPIWAACQAIMLLRQEDFDAVIESRWLQEQHNAAASGVWQFADRAAVAAFCAHYESWTLGLWKDLAPRADFVIGRDAAYDYYSMRG